jgi:hypothetical protein
MRALVSSPLSLFIATTVLFAAFFLADTAFASTTDVLLPTSDGNYTQWTPSAGTSHFANVDDSSCNGNTDFNSTTAAGNRDSYGITVSSIPNGATITQIDIKPCASRVNSGGTAPVVNIFYRANGTNSADSGSYSLSGTTPTDLATTTYSGLSITKGATSTLEIGAVLTSGTKGAKLSRIATFITYTPLTAPSSLSAGSTTASTTKLTWSDNSSNETGFNVERSSDGISFTGIASTSANTVSYTDTGLTASTTYYYRVHAFNSGGYSAYTNTATTTTLDTVPSAPSGLSASSSQTLPQIALSWTDNSSNETAFEVQRSTNGVNFSHIATTSVNATSFTNTGLNSLTTYTYKVRAYGSAGYSGFSNAASSTTSTIPATATSVSAVSSTTALSIAVSWTDNANNELNYALAVSTSSATSTFKVASTLAPDTTSATYVPTLTNTTYYFEVMAINGYGTSTSATASTTSATTPSAPSSLTATAISSSEIDLTWTDNSSNELGFNVQRSTDAFNWTTIASTAPNTTSYNDTGLTAGTHYLYQVRAFNDVGYSSFSNTADATTSNVSIPAPVAYWKLDESSGDAADATGNGYTLTNESGVSYSTGLINNAADFGSSNSNMRLHIGSIMGATTSEPVTISGWVNLNAPVSGPTYMLLEKSFASPASVVYAIGYQYNGGSPRLFFSRDQQGVQSNDAFYSITLATSTWYHVALSYDGSTVTGYVNGQSVATVASSGDGNSTQYSDEFDIGAADGPAQFSSAKIDEVGTWNQTLSDSQVAALYNGGAGRPYSTF